MGNCDYCGKDISPALEWKPKFGIAKGKQFCGYRCLSNYKKKLKGIEIPKSQQELNKDKIKENLLDDLKKKQVERKIELKISGKKPTKEDKLREQKIVHLQEEFKNQPVSKPIKVKDIVNIIGFVICLFFAYFIYQIFGIIFAVISFFILFGGWNFVTNVINFFEKHS